jgi:hypothetical protein
MLAASAAVQVASSAIWASAVALGWRLLKMAYRTGGD